MVALLVAIAVMGVLMSAVLPAWKTAVQREREEELVFRGEQYARSVGLFQRKFAGAFPPSVEVLVQQKFLRRAYRTP
jgi:type II secretory pathway pseudopilin PulG